uniref:Tripartite motif-containing protein 2 n=2 Tax=Macrostomum lignano TaxID=282301 RepID=A0A1I8G351_9PLAT
MDTKATCFVRLCRNPSARKSPISDQPLCEHHLQADLRKCENAEAAVADRIAHFRNYQRPLRLMQQRLASDMELLCDTFQDLRDSFEKCQAELTEAVSEHYEKVSESLATLAVVDDLETEFRTAKNESDLRQAFLITENMDKSLESLELNSELVCMNEGKTEVTMAAFPDVNSMVKNLQMSFEMSLQLAQKLVKSLDIRACKSQGGPSTDVVPKQNNVQLIGTPSCLTVWNSTEGFALDGSGSIVKAKTASGHQVTQVSETRQLPPKSILVAVDRSASEKNVVLVSFDSEEVGKVPGSWDQPIRDLHCDTKLQLLFIAQDRQLIIADMCGVEQSRVGISDLQDDVQKLRCIAGDSDKLFILAERADGKPVIFGLSKKSNEVQLKLAVTGIDKAGARPRISVRDRMLFIDDGEKLHTVCSITGMLLASNSVQDKGKFDLNAELLRGNRNMAALVAQQVSSGFGTPYFGAAIKVPFTDDSVIEFSTDGKRCVAFDVANNSLRQRVFEF